MATALEKDRIAHDGNFQARVSCCLMNKARTMLSASGEVDDDSSFAAQVVTGQTSIYLYALGVLTSDPTGLDASDEEDGNFGLTDAVLDAAVDSVWPSMVKHRKEVLEQVTFTRNV